MSEHNNNGIEVPAKELSEIMLKGTCVPKARALQAQKIAKDLNRKQKQNRKKDASRNPDNLGVSTCMGKKTAQTTTLGYTSTAVS
jgi:hypothetical protein